jgi:hypothetical protein
LVLSLLSVTMFFVPLVASVSLPTALRPYESIRLLAAIGTLSVVTGSLVVILDLARILLAQSFLQAVCQGLQGHALARSIQHLIYTFAGVICLGVITIILNATLGILREEYRRDSMVVVVLMAALVFSLSTAGLAIYWFIRYLITLFQVQSLVSETLQLRK